MTRIGAEVVSAASSQLEAVGRALKPELPDQTMREKILSEDLDHAGAVAIGGPAPGPAGVVFTAVDQRRESRKNTVELSATPRLEYWGAPRNFAPKSPQNAVNGRFRGE
jgi:hypothetical protein